jgi:hypothetical protein
MLPELPEKPQVVTVDVGTLKVWVPRKGLVFTRASGRMVTAHADLIIEAVGRACDECPVDAVAVHDWLDVESYEIAVYARMSAWSPRVIRAMRRVAIGVRSPMVALAVRTANLAVGGRFEVIDDSERIVAAARAEWQRQKARA